MSTSRVQKNIFMLKVMRREWNVIFYLFNFIFCSQCMAVVLEWRSCWMNVQLFCIYNFFVNIYQCERKQLWTVFVYDTTVHACLKKAKYYQFKIMTLIRYMSHISPAKVIQQSQRSLKSFVCKANIAVFKNCAPNTKLKMTFILCCKVR